MPRSCDRAREWSSLEVDGELSAFELALLQAHVARCPDCEAFRAGIAGVTGLLLAAELERPSEPIRMPSSARSRSRFRAQRVLAPIAVAAVIVLAAISATSRLPGGSEPFRPDTQPAQSGGPPNADLIEQRNQRRAQLSQIVRFPTNTPGGPQLADANSN
jgi:hypothetical protein